METNKQEVPNRTYLMQYVLGFGEVGVQSGRLRLTHKKNNAVRLTVPFIDLSILQNQENIGKDLTLATESDQHVQIIFTNIESLEVLQRALDFCRKELETRPNQFKFNGKEPQE